MPSRDAQRYQVRVNGIANSSYEVLRIQESAGGRSLDNATLLYVPDQAPLFQDYSVPAGIDDEVEIIAVDNVGNPVASNPVKHWGTLAAISPVLTSSGQQWRYLSRCEHHLFGFALTGAHVWNPNETKSRFLEQDIVFNPIIDGKVVGNKHPTDYISSDVVGSGIFASCFLDPESCRTTAAQTLQGGTAELWTLSSALFSLIWTLNPYQTYVTNPQTTLELADSVLINSEDIRNVVIPRGTYLPEALDMLCRPVGFRWRLVRGVGYRVLKFYKEGKDGSAVSVNMQRIGATLNTSQTNLKQSSISFSAAETANSIVIQGAPTLYEFTVELARGWSDGDDTADFDSLRKSDPDFDDVKDVFRRWVLNEAGDYIGLRSEIDDVFTSSFRSTLNSYSLLNAFVPRRRRFLPTLTLDSTGKQPIGKLRGIDVEYLDWDGSTWLPIGNWGCRVLQQECGLYFDGETVPEELHALGTQAKIRVTAAIESDIRVSATANTAGAGSPLDKLSQVVVRADSQYQNRVITVSSQYSGGGNPTLAADHTTIVQEKADRMNATYDRLDIQGTLVLEGVDRHSYTLLDRVQDIQPRNIGFQTKAGLTNYPHIVGITYDIENQQTILELQRSRRLVV